MKKGFGFVIVTIIAVSFLKVLPLYAHSEQKTTIIDVVPQYEVAPSDLKGTYDWEEAKVACQKYKINGKKDWIVPSKAILSEMYSKRKVIGGFTTEFYWSSTDGDQGDDAWGIGFSDGNGGPATPPKYHNRRQVRCVRAY